MTTPLPPIADIKQFAEETGIAPRRLATLFDCRPSDISRHMTKPEVPNLLDATATEPIRALARRTGLTIILIDPAALEELPETIKSLIGVLIRA